MTTKTKACEFCSKKHNRPDDLTLPWVCPYCGKEWKPRKPAPKLETQWSYCLDYGPEDQPNRSGMSGGKATQGETIADMFRMVAYYLGLGYVVSGRLVESCKLCCGTGQVRRKRSRRLYSFKPCPCKGKLGQTIDCGRFDLSTGVSINVE